MIKTVRSVMVACFMGPLIALAGPTAEPQCAQVICLSPADGTPAPPECGMIRQVYFNIRVFNPYYNPSATSNLRHQYIAVCSTARTVDLNKITQKYGTLFYDPMVY